MFSLFLLIGNFDIKFLASVGDAKVWGPSSAEHVRTLLFEQRAGF